MFALFVCVARCVLLYVCVSALPRVVPVAKKILQKMFDGDTRNAADIAKAEVRCVPLY